MVQLLVDTVQHYLMVVTTGQVVQALVVATAQKKVTEEATPDQELMEVTLEVVMEVVTKAMPYQVKVVMISVVVTKPLAVQKVMVAMEATAATIK